MLQKRSNGLTREIKSIFWPKASKKQALQGKKLSARAHSHPTKATEEEAKTRSDPQQEARKKRATSNKKPPAAARVASCLLRELAWLAKLVGCWLRERTMGMRAVDLIWLEIYNE